MKYVHAYRTPVLRFRRWCRKGYAVFSSLGRQVIIGRACKSIADASLRKSGVLPLSACPDRADRDPEDASCPPGEADSSLLFSPLTVEMTVMGMAPVLVCTQEAVACARCHVALVRAISYLDFYITSHTPSADDVHGENVERRPRSVCPCICLRRRMALRPISINHI